MKITWKLEETGGGCAAIAATLGVYEILITDGAGNLPNEGEEAFVFVLEPESSEVRCWFPLGNWKADNQRATLENAESILDYWTAAGEYAHPVRFEDYLATRADGKAVNVCPSCSRVHRNGDSDILGIRGDRSTQVVSGQSLCSSCDPANEVPEP